ncbi:MAG: type II toxin-antitoxin system HicA family toxin [Methyloceanibacter sp.]
MVSDRKLADILAQVVDGRGLISFRDFESLLIGLGFSLRRQKGSHRIYVHPDLHRPFPVQPDGRDAKRYQVRQLRAMIEKFNLALRS